MRYVIGVDQGGSGTRAVICDLEGHLLGTGIGPGACHAFSGLDTAMDATQSAVRKAFDQAGMQPGQAVVYVGGHTGADWDDEYDLLRAAVQQLGFAEKVVIVNDSIAALRGGTDQAFGAILVAGSGANCAVLAPDGVQFIYHYYHDNDLQGGSALARAALNAIYRAETGRPPQTSLRERVLSLFNLPDVDALMRGSVEGKIPENRVLEIAPLVFEEAQNGDAAAIKIVSHFGSGCAELLVNGIQRLGMSDLAVEIVLSGGIFKAESPLLREVLSREMIKEVPHAKFVDARYEPVVGAALLALKQQGIEMDAKTKKNIDDSARKLSLLRKSVKPSQ
ncbi:MAG: N-acetylglucosamine kinase [Anaerolineales bacterium]|jgi:N-acetylglucosamine kinase-like BadF-type ATPase